MTTSIGVKQQSSVIANPKPNQFLVFLFILVISSDPI
jgi:hypothetical protein